MVTDKEFAELLETAVSNLNSCLEEARNRKLSVLIENNRNAYDCGIITQLDSLTLQFIHKEFTEVLYRSKDLTKISNS